MASMRQLTFSILLLTLTGIAHGDNVLVQVPGVQVDADGTVRMPGVVVGPDGSVSAPGVEVRGSDGGSAGNTVSTSAGSGMSYSGTDLRGSDFRGQDLSGASFSAVDLRGADLSGANLTGATFVGTDLRNAKLRNACLQNAKMTGNNLASADLTGATLTGAAMVGNDLRNATMHNVIRNADCPSATASARPAVTKAAEITQALAAPDGKVDLTVNFETDSDKIKADAHVQVMEIANALRAPELSDARVRIEGHTDSVGENDYNLDLSYRRAIRVMRNLVEEYGIPSDRFEVKGFGEDQPVASNVSDNGRALNRRVTLVNLGAG